ncbi:glycosyl hydrolase family 95 catalytic domain-containing protein [Kitasatospora sp. NPDC088346]|uniref:glycosyl hydrolase family 95 catalytic domain-containing protein n=1 Tax=Kitasatospora sp. NPDC088346 TaxID=3364073 RepID=UPI003816AA22
MKLRKLLRRVGSTATAALLVSAGLATVTPQLALADSVTSNQAMRIVQQYQGDWTSPPTIIAGGKGTDAPLLGNGDVGVVIGGSINNQTYYIGKNDFFSASSHAIRPLGRIVLAVPGMAGASYHMVQNIAQAQVQGTYVLGGSTLNTTSWVSASDNLHFTSMTLSGSASQSATFTVQDGFGGTPTTSVTNGVLNADVVADTVGSNNPQARMASKVIGGTSTTSGNQISLTLQPGVTYTFVSAIISNIDTPNYQSYATDVVGNLNQSWVDSINSDHRSSWQTYWSRSYVEIADKAIEKSWYGSLYQLRCVSRAGKYAPGLWGNWITGTMAWKGDYHTNYNFEAPFYAALSTNHIDQMASYDQPVLDWMSAGQALAAQNGFQGVLYPVGLSPNGTSADRGLYKQKSDAANLASDMIMRFKYTRDANYAATVYPFLKQVGLFWQNYLTLDSSGTYNITNDSPLENLPYPQTNSIVSLGLVHLLFQGLTDISITLNQDASLRTTWQNIDTHLAPLPTMTQNGQTVFRLTSEGASWDNNGNDVNIQAVYPGSEVGLNSSPSALQTARNTVGQLTKAWHGGNAPATFYAAAARVGYDPSTILANLHTEATTYSYKNLAVHHDGGGIENINVVTSGLNEMLLQSFQQDVKVFANWPANSSAKFGDLLAYNNFLISSSISNNSVEYVRAVSQSGRTLTLTNPWPGQSVQVYRNGANAGTVSGTTLTLTTSTNETLHFAPAGTSLATINMKLGQSL